MKYYLTLARLGEAHATNGQAHVVITDSDDGFDEVTDMDAVLVWPDGIMIFRTLDEAMTMLEKAVYASRTLN